MYDEVLNIVDELDDIEFMSEMAVMDAMFKSYMKEAAMLQYVSEEYIQEGVFKDAIGDKSENIFKRIFLFIPRLIGSIIRWIGSKFSKAPNNAATSAKNAASVVQSLNDENYKKLEQAADAIDKANASAKGMPSDEEIHKVAVQMQQNMVDWIATRPDLQMPDKEYHTSDGRVVKNGETVRTEAPAKNVEQIEKVVKKTLSDLNGKGFIQTNKDHIRTDYVFAGDSVRLTSLIRAMRSGKMQLSFDIDAFNKNMEYWTKIANDLETAICEFNSGNTDKFEEMAIRIHEENKNSVHHPDYDHKSAMATDVADGNNYKSIPISDFHKKINELSERANVLRKRLEAIIPQFDHGDEGYGRLHNHAMSPQSEKKYGPSYENKLMDACEKIYAALGGILNNLRRVSNNFVSDGNRCRDVMLLAQAFHGNLKYKVSQYAVNVDPDYFIDTPETKSKKSKSSKTVKDIIDDNLKANDQMSKDVKNIGNSIDEAEKKNPGLKQALADIL